jgi:hypothetical protein
MVASLRHTGNEQFFKRHAQAGKQPQFTAIDALTHQGHFESPHVGAANVLVLERYLDKIDSHSFWGDTNNLCVDSTCRCKKKK